jgi:hypothetical protein
MFKKICSILHGHSLLFIFHLFVYFIYSKLASCSDIYGTVEMLLLRFDTEDLDEVDRYLGPLAFALFIFIVVFMCCTIFISIINNGFRHIRLESKSTSNPEQDILELIFIKMKHELNGRKCKYESLEHREPLEHLCDKIDQLTFMLYKVFIN